MVKFELWAWTTCQLCAGNRIVYGYVDNISPDQGTTIIAIGDKNLQNVGQIELKIPANSQQNFYIETSLPADYTGDVHCTGYCKSTGNVQFNEVKQQYFDASDGCAAPAPPTEISAVCQLDGSCKLSWTPPPVGDIFTYIIRRYKNNVYDVSFETIYPEMHDNTISDCGSQYAYSIETLDKCLNLGPESPKTVPGEVPPPPPCPTPISSFTVGTQYEIGKPITATSTSTPGEGETIVQYLWTWDGNELEDSNVIVIDTTDESLGAHSLGLKVKNSCGEWSSQAFKTITLFEEVPPPPEPVPEYKEAPSNLVPFIIVGGLAGLALLGALLMKKES